MYVIGLKDFARRRRYATNPNNPIRIMGCLKISDVFIAPLTISVASAHWLCIYHAKGCIVYCVVRIAEND